MSEKKKKKELSPSFAEQEKFLAAKKVEAARKEIEELKKLGVTIDPYLANAAKRPGRPYKCMYSKERRYHLEMPELYYLFLKVKAEEEDSTIRKLILDAVTKVYKKELTLVKDEFFKTTQ